MAISTEQQSVYANLINSGKAAPMRQNSPFTPNFSQSAQPNFEVGDMAGQGRGGDTMLAHVTPGEVVIPKEVAALRPDLVAHVLEQIKSMGGDPQTIMVGRGRVNPATGIEEFATAAEVTAAYQSVLGRAPDAGGLANWMAQPDLSGFKAAAAPELATRQPAAPPPQVKDVGIIQKAYQDNFGRPAEQAGIDSWLKQGQSNPNFDYNTAIRAGAQGADRNAFADIAAGGVDTSRTWGDGADLNSPDLDYDTYNNTWGNVKKPQKNAYTYAPALLNAPAKWGITPDQTVNGQLAKTLGQDSPVMQQARTQGLQLANGLGLLNSSIAVGAAQDAVIKSALPIATSDANANLGANRLNTETQNNFSNLNAAAQNTARSFNAQQQNRTYEIDAANAYNKDMAIFQGNVEASLKQIDNQFKWDSETREIAGDIMLQGQNMKQKILIDTGKDFDTATKQQMFDQVDSWVVNTAKLTSLASQVPDMSYLLTYN